MKCNLLAHESPIRLCPCLWIYSWHLALFQRKSRPKPPQQKNSESVAHSPEKAKESSAHMWRHKALRDVIRMGNKTVSTAMVTEEGGV